MSDEGDSVGSFGLDAHRPDRSSRGIYRGERQPYESDDGEDSADEVDPKRLVRTPSTNDIRWYYRNGALASTIVDKPVNDAFKHGYDIDDGDVAEFVDELIEPFQRAHRKARRDGFALLWFRLNDTNEVYEPPANVSGLHEIKVLTLDDMSIAKPVGFNKKLARGSTDFLSTNVATHELEEVQTLSDLIDEVERGSINDPYAGDEDHDDLDIEPAPPYARSRDYEITDNGTVISERLDDERFEQPIGYIYDRGTDWNPLLIHPSRVFHIAWRRDVDGDINHETYGRWEGDAVLRPIIHLLRSIHKGNWATIQSLYRHSSPLHVMEVPEGADEEDYDRAEEAVRNINAKSSITEPPNYELRVEDNETEMDPEPHFSVLFDQICAGTEFTRSVLFGTQAGTVTGSETDIKNYFNKVERMRETRFEPELREIVEWWADASSVTTDMSVSTDAAESFDMEWGPLFKLTALDRAEAMARHVQTAATATNNYILTVDEVRSLLSESWADWTDIDFDDEMSDEELGMLDRTNTTLTKNFGQGVVPEGTETELFMNPEDSGPADTNGGNMGGNPRVGQNGGGQERGDTQGSSQPSR